VNQEGPSSSLMHLQQPYNGICGDDIREACRFDHDDST
jgi:hypothetical protein